MNYKPNDEITLLVCRKTLKVGCAIIQAGAGYDNNIVSFLFSPESWETSPTPFLSPLTLTYEKWESFSNLANQGQESRDYLLGRLLDNEK